MTTNLLETLFAIEQIKQLKARYFRFMDTKDWEGLASVFVKNAILDMRREGGEGSTLVEGAQNIANYIREGIDPVVTVHHGHMPEIEIQSATTAHGIWAMEDKLWKPENSPSTLPFTTMHGYGHYFETYEKIADRWLIKTVSLERLRRDAQ